MVNPPSTEEELREIEKPNFPGKRRAPAEQEISASPVLKKGRPDQLIMKRTPQPNLTQPKLTSMLQANPASSLTPLEGAGDHATKPPVSAGVPPLGGPGEMLNADFFRRLIGENTATVTAKLDKVTGDLAALARTVESSKSEVAAVTEEVGRHTTELADHRTRIEDLTERLARLERKEVSTIREPKLSPDYLLARRSVRMWPIENTNSQTLWKGVPSQGARNPRE